VHKRRNINYFRGLPFQFLAIELYFRSLVSLVLIFRFQPTWLMCICRNTFLRLQKVEASDINKYSVPCIQYPSKPNLVLSATTVILGVKVYRAQKDSPLYLRAPCTKKSIHCSLLWETDLFLGRNTFVTDI